MIEGTKATTPKSMYFQHTHKRKHGSVFYRTTSVLSWQKKYPVSSLRDSSSFSMGTSYGLGSNASHTPLAREPHQSSEEVRLVTLPTCHDCCRPHGGPHASSPLHRPAPATDNLIFGTSRPPPTNSLSSSEPSGFRPRVFLLLTTASHSRSVASFPHETPPRPTRSSTPRIRVSPTVTSRDNIGQPGRFSWASCLCWFEPLEEHEGANSLDSPHYSYTRKGFPSGPGRRSGPSGKLESQHAREPEIHSSAS